MSSFASGLPTFEGSLRALLMMIVLALWVESLLSLLLSNVFEPMKGKLCKPAANKWQVVSTLVMGYVHSNLKPIVANVQLPPWPTHRWWVNWLALLTISYHSPHQCFRNHGINLPDKVQCLPYARMADSVMDLIWLKLCLLGNTAHAQYGVSGVFLMWSTHHCVTLVMFQPHQDCIYR